MPKGNIGLVERDISRPRAGLTGKNPLPFFCATAPGLPGRNERQILVVCGAAGAPDEGGRRGTTTARPSSCALHDEFPDGDKTPRA